MTIATQEIKEELGLGMLSGKFLDFLCNYFQFVDGHSTEYIAQQLEPWFTKSDETKDEFGTALDTHSQFYAEVVQQKYRLALEFCALEAGFDNVILHDPDTGVPISGGLFWLKDCHPQPIRWSMQVGDRVLARGTEEPDTLNIETIENWLTDRILGFASLRRKEFLDEEV